MAADRDAATRGPGRRSETGGGGRPFAVVDLGTNTALLLVARCEGGLPVPLHESLRMPRLGQGSGPGRPLRPEAVERAVAAVAELVREARRLGADPVQVVATAAVRDAASDAGLRERIEAVSGLPLRVLSTREEAEASARGALSGLPRPVVEPVAVLDVGGGSTEVARVEGGRVLRSSSVPVGSVRLTERLLHHDPPTPAEREAVLRAAREALREAPLQGAATLVAVAGTATTLAALELGLRDYDAGRVHGHRLGLERVASWFDRLAALPIARRKVLPGLDPRRADVIVAGVALVLEALRSSGAEALLVSDRGVRWGVAAQRCEPVARRQ